MASRPSVFRRYQRDTICFWLTTFAVGLFIVIRYSHSWYFLMDDWVVFGSRLDQKSLYGIDDFLLRRHNEHLIGGLVAWNVGLGAIFGLASYTPWAISVVLANVFVVWVVRGYMVRLGVRPLWAAVASPMFLVIAPLGTLSYWSFDQVFILTLAMNLLHFGLTLHPGKRITKRDLLGSMTSSIGVFIFSVSVITIPVIVGIQLWRRQWARATLALIPLLLYGAWSVTYRERAPSMRWLATSSNAGSPPQERDLSLFLSFGWKLISRTMWSNSNPMIFVVAISLIVYGIWTLWSNGSDKKIIMTAAISVSVLYIGGFTWSRGVFTDRILRIDPPDRYVSVLALLLLPICLLSVQSLLDRMHLRTSKFSARPRKAVLAFAALMIVLVTVGQRFAQDERIRGYAMGSRNRIMEVARDPNLPAFPPQDFVFGSSWPTDLTFGDVLRLRNRGWL